MLAPAWTAGCSGHKNVTPLVLDRFTHVSGHLLFVFHTFRDVDLLKTRYGCWRLAFRLLLARSKGIDPPFSE